MEKNEKNSVFNSDQRISKFIMSKLKPAFGFLNIETAMENLKVSNALFPKALKTKVG